MEIETKFKKNDIVYERVNPYSRLVVEHYTDGLYYCRLQGNHKRQFAFQERELKADFTQTSTPALVL